MSVDDVTTTPPERASADKAASDDIEKSTPTHGENKKETKEASYLPQNDEDYNVTFKTWIVVWVGPANIVPLAPLLELGSLFY
jgi:hypothetical protein